MSEATSLVPFFVGFILTATGVQATCPIELSPPRVVVRYGDPVSVNCSTSVSQNDGMGWEAKQGGTGLKMGNHLTWTVEKLTEWTTSPVCFINLRNMKVRQCLRKLEIVIYTFPENISINSSSDSDGVMRENEQYNLTCHIHQVAPVKYLIVTWYKGDRPGSKFIFYNSTEKPVDKLSVFTFTPTRRDNGVTFRCEATMDLGPEGPQLNVSSQEINISVHYGPDVQCSVIDILEGETLESKCPVEGNPTPSVRWMKDGKLINQSIPLTRQNAGLYIVEAQGASNLTQKIQVLVIYGPQLSPQCQGSYTALEYTPLNRTCTAEGYPKPEITWYKDGGEVELIGNLTRRDAGLYEITASNNLSSVNVTLEINVIYPPSLIVELEDSEVEIGSAVSLKCSSTGNPRPTYIWNYFRAANVMEENEDGVSLLVIHNATAYNTGSYTCYASNKGGNVSKTARLTVKDATPECPIEITPHRMVIPYRGPTQTAACKPTSDDGNVKGIYWEVHGIKIHNEKWSPDTREDWDPRPVCNATFKGLGTCRKAVHFTLYKTPDSVSIRLVRNRTSVVEGSELQLQCDIISVAPAQNLTVRWYQGNDTLQPLIRGPMRVAGCRPEDGTKCDISVVRSPVNLSSTISITVNRKHNGAEFRCEAQMDLGPEGPQPPPNMTSEPLNITVDYKPAINTTKLPKKIPVFRGYPEDLVCEADGHPRPNIQWIYSPYKVPHLSKDTLTVSEAGLYNCTATNEIDSTFYVVEVILKEDYLPLIAGFVAVTVVAISIVFVFIYSIYYKNTRMRRYSLKNPRLSTHNGNVAHNGWDMQFPMTKLSYLICAWPFAVPQRTLVSAHCQVVLSSKSVVVGFGHSFSVNCSSLSNQTAEMGWESRQDPRELTPGVTFLTLEVSSVKLWKLSPQCYVNLNDKTQCAERLPVTVYKMPDSVSMPQPSQPASMVEGEKRVVKCDVTNVAPVRNLSVLFHKGNKIVSTYTFNDSSLEPVNVSSVYDLIAHRDDNGSQIWCEAKLNFLTTGLQDTSMRSESQKVIVLYPPTFDEPENETLEVPAADKIILNCNAIGNPALVYSWHSPPPVQQTDMNPYKNQLILTRPLQFPGTYNCTASNLQGTTTKYFTLVEAPRNRSTFAAIVGGLVFLGLVLIVAGVYVVKPDGTFSLNKGSYQPTSSGIVRMYILINLTLVLLYYMFKPLLLTQMLWCLWIYTFAAIMFMRSLHTHDRAVCFSRGRCHLLNFPLFPFAPHPQSQLGRPGPFCFEHSSLQSCQAQFKFSFSAHPFFNRRLSAENIMGSYFVRWILTLCMFCSVVTLLMCVSVSGEGCSLILKPSRVVVGFGEPVTVSCEAARPVRVLGWESAISASHTQQDLSIQWKVDSLIDWIEEPICYGVFFTAPRQCEEKLNLVLYKTPDRVSIRPVNHTGPMVEGKEYQLLCEVQNVAPVQYLTLRWYRGQSEVYNHTYSDLTSSSPVQVSSILVVTPTRAENGAQYRCVAELELGPEGPQPPPTVASEPLNASVYFPPTFLSPEPEVLELTLGVEISLNCTATGNPTPVYSWQSSHPTQERMEDEAVLTFSSLVPGTYICTASNALDKKSKQFIVKAKTKGV
ncbi:hemicentin-1 [Hippoglossus stenolepis]|uniref:hemicentin-1 n=1 Tax=Hippoglossus stenolepis TaxID=195615 RepID=UPI001FAE9579|nr:hemicentin-1 [Hippoglossus stenolepis]